MFYLGQQTAVITIRAQDKGRVQNRCQHLKSSPKSTTLSKIGSFTHLHLLTWLNGWRSRITVDIIAESILYFLNSAPTLTSSEAGKAWTHYHYFYSLKMSYTTSFCQASLSAFDLSLNKGRQPRTVSSFLSTGAFDPLLVSSILLWTWSKKFISIKILRKKHYLNGLPGMFRPHVSSHSRVGGFPWGASNLASPDQFVAMQASY